MRSKFLSSASKFLSKIEALRLLFRKTLLLLHLLFPKKKNYLLCANKTETLN